MTANYSIIRPKSHDEWLDERKKGIGSSEVGTILGVNPWETPYQLWRRKMGIDPAKQETFAMKAGHYLEDAVSLFYQDESGNKVIKSSAGDWIAVDKERDFLRVSPDRTFWIGQGRGKNNKGILECKTTQMTINPNDIPAAWFFQLTYQMGVMGCTEGAIAWLTAGRNFDYQHITFDRDAYDYAVTELEKFWKDNIVGGAEPPAITAEDIALKYPEHINGKMVEASDKLVADIAELKQLKANISCINERKGELEGEIKVFMGDAEGITDERGNKLVTFKKSKDGSKFDEGAFKEDHPEIYSKYIKKVAGTRRLIIK